MSLNSTVYDVQVRYSLDDKASAALAHLGETASRTERHVGGLKEGLMTLAEVFAAREAFHVGKELFIDFNSQMEQLKISMGAVASMNFGMPFDQASQKVDALVEGWQRFSMSTTLTTKQISEFGKQVSASVAAAGGGLKDIDAIARRGSVVASALVGNGEGDLQYAGLELSEAIMSGVRKTQRFNMQLLVPELKKQGKTIEEFNNAAIGDRLKMVKTALNDPAWNAAIERMGRSWGGVTSTLKDLIEIVGGGKAGGALFKVLKDEIKGVNDWLKKNEELVAEYAERFGHAMVEGFKSLKDAVMFLVQHKDAIIKIGEVWVASKVFGAMGGAGGLLGGLSAAGASGGMLGGGNALGANLGAIAGGSKTFWAATESALKAGAPSFGQVLGGAFSGVLLAKLSGDMSAFSVAAHSALGALGTLPGPLGLLANAAQLAYTGLQKLAEEFDNRHKGATASDAETGALADYIKKSDVGRLKSFVKSIGAVKNGDLNEEALAQYITKQRGISAYGLGGMIPGFDQLAEQDARRQAMIVAELLKGHMGDSPFYGPTQEKKKEDPLDGAKGSGGHNVNVTIHKIEVASPDPDRFAFAFGRAVGRMVRNPTQARDAFREG